MREYKKSKKETKQVRLLSKEKRDLQKNVKERELLEKESPVKSKVQEKISAPHIQLKKELRIL